MSGLQVTQAGHVDRLRQRGQCRDAGLRPQDVEQVTTSAGDAGISVRVDAVNRELDQYVQRQLRVEILGRQLRRPARPVLRSAAGGLRRIPARQRRSIRLFNNFTTSLQALSGRSRGSPRRAAGGELRAGADPAAQQHDHSDPGVAQRRRTRPVRRGYAGQRRDAGASPDQPAARHGDQQRCDHRLSCSTSATSYIDQLVAVDGHQGRHQATTIRSRCSPIRASSSSATSASQLAFDAQGTMTPTAQWSADPQKRTVGTITCVGPNGGNVDLIANKSIRSGKIAAYLDMRDNVLVQAQAQLDQIAAGLASALSDHTDRRNAGRPGRAVGLRHRSQRNAGWQFDQPDLYRQRHATPAHGHDRARRRSLGAALVQQRNDRSERQGHRPRFFRWRCHRS